MGSLRDWDRNWWANLMVGLAFCVAAVVTPWYLLIQDLRDAPFIAPDAYAFNIGMDVFIGLISLGGAVLFLLMGARARNRHAKRLAALRGDLSDMPLATIQPDPAQAPDVSAQPLEVMWRVAGPIVIVARVFIVPYFLIVMIGGIGGYISLGIAPFFAPSMLAHPLSPSEIAQLAAISCGIFAIFAVIAGMGWYAGRTIPMYFGRPFGVRATPEGVESRTADSGARSFIAWDEVRLFEAIGSQGNALRSFALYGQGKSVIWRDYASGLSAWRTPYHATASENAQRQTALLNLVTARTGLELRTLDKALRRDVGGAAGSTPQVG